MPSRYFLQDLYARDILQNSNNQVTLSWKGTNAITNNLHISNGNGETPPMHQTYTADQAWAGELPARR